MRRLNRLLGSDERAEALGFVEGGLDAGSGPVVERTPLHALCRAGLGYSGPACRRQFRRRRVPKTIAASFEKEATRRFFGRAIEGLDIEIVSWSVKASSPLPPVERVPSVAEGNVVRPGKT